jgi:hypothetical protein
VPVLDPRLTPARHDLAAAHLKGVVEAERYVEPVEMQCVAPAAPIRRAPSDVAPMDDQLLAGEGFAVLEQTDGWAWGFSRADAYVGWVNLNALSGVPNKPDQRVCALRTYAFSSPDFKSAPRCLLSLNSVFEAGQKQGRFVEALGLGWVVADHCAPINKFASDFVAVAEQFRSAPYLWGGKESLGLDCSGLLQMALMAAGMTCPRDADQQEAHLIENWDTVTDQSVRRRGDVVFWPGHVGIMTTTTALLHANATTMDVTSEAFSEAELRIRESENPVRTIVRMPPAR